jgi:hypothetical protein
MDKELLTFPVFQLDEYEPIIRTLGAFQQINPLLRMKRNALVRKWVTKLPTGPNKKIIVYMPTRYSL